MKILTAIVIPPHLAHSGAVTAGKELSLALSDYCDVEIAIMSFEDHREKHGRCSLLHRRSRNLFSFLARYMPNKLRTPFYISNIPELIRESSYDLIHIHNVIPTFEMARIARACVSNGVPYVISTHGIVEVMNSDKAYALNIFEEFFWQFLIDKPLRYVVDHAKMVFLTSPVEIPLINSFGRSDNDIAIVPSGVNERYLYNPDYNLMVQICNKFDLPVEKDANIPVCCFLGNHTKNKGVKVLLDAFSLTEKPYILIVGGEKRPYINYELHSGSRKIGQRIIFTDKLSNNEVLGIFQYSDLFVFPTLADTFPLVILEAMASRLPVLATRVGGIPYQVQESCGYLVEPGDPIALMRGFEFLTSDMQKLKTMGTSAAKAAKSFTWTKSAERAFLSYSQVLHNTIV